jgi:pimeloyl-ACP methyl ester carboxylesterase
VVDDDPGRRPDHGDTGGDGPPVVLTPGLLFDHASFDAQVEELGDVWRMIAWDLHAAARRPARTPNDCWDLAVELLGLLDRLGIERAVLVGAGEGGAVATRATLMSPDRVRGLVLIASEVDREPAGRRQRFDDLVAAWRHDGLTDEVARLAAELVVGAAAADPLRPLWTGWTPQELEWGVSCLLDRDDVSGRLPEIDAPALVVHGAEDRAVPPERVRAICDALHDCRGPAEIDGGGHAPHLTHPEAVNRVLRAFLEELPG